MPERDRQPPATPPPQTTQRAEHLVTVETQQEHDLLTGERVERIFVKLYQAARTSGLMAVISDRDWKTLCVLATYMNRDGYCYPSQGELAKALGVSRQMANDRVHSLAQFRFQGKPVMLMQDDQDRGGHGRFGGKRYRVLPLASLKIFDDHKPTVERRSQGSTRSTVSTPLDTVESTVSSPTVTVQLDTNKNQESLEQEQQQGTRSARRVAVPAGKGSDVVVSRLIGKRRTSTPTAGAPSRTALSKTAPGVAPVTPPMSAVELEAFGLADLTNELVTRGVSLPAAQKWLRKRPPEYIRQLLEYHDWCQEHRKGFIHDSGAWLAASLVTPIPIPEQYLKAKARAHGKAEQGAREAEEQVRREAEEVRRRATELAQEPGDWARRRLQTYEDGQKLLGRPPLTEAQRREREAQYTTSWSRQRAAFLAEHPEFAELLGRTIGTPADVAPAPDEALEAATQTQLQAWRQERHAAQEEQSLQNEAARQARSPEERADDALRGLDENADALGQPRLSGGARAERRRVLVAQFQAEQRGGEPSPAPSWKAPEGRFHGPDERHRPNDHPAPKNALSKPLRASPTALQIAERSGRGKGANGSVTTSRLHRPPGPGRCRALRGVP